MNKITYINGASAQGKTMLMVKLVSELYKENNVHFITTDMLPNKISLLLDRHMKNNNIDKNSNKLMLKYAINVETIEKIIIESDSKYIAIDGITSIPNFNIQKMKELANQYDKHLIVSKSIYNHNFSPIDNMFYLTQEVLSCFKNLDSYQYFVSKNKDTNSIDYINITNNTIGSLPIDLFVKNNQLETI